MKRIVAYLSISIYSIFLGSQIAEGALLVPYWKSLSPVAFFSYYSEFGPSIGKFYTILTIIASLIPLVLCIYCYSKKSPALKYALISTLCAFLVIGSFYGYFKGANQEFYAGLIAADQLQASLKTWGTWHWVRVLFEVLALVFLMFSFRKLQAQKPTSVA